MSRVNCGINPIYLSDQHLIAESVEIIMITGSLRKNKYLIKSEIPATMNLGKGYINFFKNKIWYLAYRLEKVNDELSRRGIKNSTEIVCDEFPDHLVQMWNPKIEDSMIIRERIVDRLFNPIKAKPGFHRFWKIPIKDIENFTQKILASPLYQV